jgi:hypothetical protein
MRCDGPCTVAPQWRFTFRLKTTDGAPADPSMFKTSRGACGPGTIPLGYKTLRVVDVRDGRDDEDPILVVEDVSE